MATDRLFNILTFVGIPIGGTQTLPHGLILRDVPVEPDLVLLQFSADFELVTATPTTVTIRNTGNPTGDCSAWVSAIHPAIRLLGLQPDDGLMSQGLTPRPYCPGSPNGSATATYVVVLRPGGLAVQNVVTTWADAMERLAALQGQRILEFDDSIVSPIVVPAGTWDMANVIWSGGGVGKQSPTVQVVEGAVFTNLRHFDDHVIVDFTGTSPPVTDFDVTPPIPDTVILDHGARITCSGAGPFFRLSTAGGVGISLRLRNGAGVVAGANAILDLAIAGAQAMIIAEGAQTELQSDTISGSVASILTLIVGGAGIAGLSEVQTAFLGTLVPQNTTKDRRYPDGPFTTDQILSRTSDLVLVDPTGGPINLTLPLALNARGQSITVKNVSISPNNVTLTASGADSVEGAPALVLGGPLFHAAVTSDGVDTWWVTD